MRVVIVENNVIINIAEGGPDDGPLPAGITSHPFEGFCSIGWTWNDGAPVDPNPPPAPVYVPQSIPNWKGQAILIQRGLYDKGVAAIAALADPIQRQVAQIAFESADFTRDSVLLNTILTQLGQTSAQIDQLFIDGSAVTL